MYETGGMRFVAATAQHQRRYKSQPPVYTNNATKSRCINSRSHCIKLTVHRTFAKVLDNEKSSLVLVLVFVFVQANIKGPISNNLGNQFTIKMHVYVNG